MLSWLRSFFVVFWNVTFSNGNTLLEIILAGEVTNDSCKIYSAKINIFLPWMWKLLNISFGKLTLCWPSLHEFLSTVCFNNWVFNACTWSVKFLRQLILGIKKNNATCGPSVKIFHCVCLDNNSSFHGHTPVPLVWCWNLVRRLRRVCRWGALIQPTCSYLHEHVC